jgi:hypothetical protein
MAHVNRCPKCSTGYYGEGCPECALDAISIPIPSPHIAAAMAMSRATCEAFIAQCVYPGEVHTGFRYHGMEVVIVATMPDDFVQPLSAGEVALLRKLRCIS